MTATKTTTASPSKLRSGEWGARVDGDVKPGDTITITTRSGKSWDATVSKVIWQGEGVTLVATGPGTTARTSRHTGRRRYPRVECCRACGGNGNVEQELGQCMACGIDFD